MLGRTVEDAASVIEPLLPWTAAGAYMASTLGVPTLEYLPWAIQNWIAIPIALVLAATGLGIARLKGHQALAPSDGGLESTPGSAA